MAATFLEAGSDSTFGLEHYAPGSAGITSDSALSKTGPRSLKADTAAGINTWIWTPNGVLANAGGRASCWLRFSAAPASDGGIVEVGTANFGGDVLTVCLTTGRLLSLKDFVTGATLGTGSNALAVDTWYRVSIAFTLTSTTVNEMRVYLDGVLEITVSNATLPAIGASVFAVGLFGSGGASWGASKTAQFDDIYCDNDSSLADTGDIRVTAKRPNATGPGATRFDTQIGTGGSGYGAGRSPQVNERALSVTNGWRHNASTDAREDFTIEDAATGDVDITGLTIVARASWIRAALSSLTGTPSTDIVNNNVLTAWDAIAANTPETKVNYVTDSAYPSHASAVGSTSSVIAADTFLYECGMLIAYLAPGFTAARSVAGSLPSPSGALTRLKAALRSLAGSIPAQTGTLSRAKAALRALAGAMPTATGILTRVYQTVRFLAGDLPSQSGTLAFIRGYVRTLAGSLPAPTGILARAYQALRSIAGNLPSMSGVLDAVVTGGGPAAYFRDLAGSLPSPTGALARIYQAARAVAGSLPSQSGALSRLYQASRSLTGDLPSSSGTLARTAALVRALAGNLPAQSGAVSRMLAAVRSLSASLPSPSGILSQLTILPGIEGPRGVWRASARKIGQLGTIIRKQGALAGSTRKQGDLGSTTRKQGDLGDSGRKRGTWEDD